MQTYISFKDSSKCQMAQLLLWQLNLFYSRDQFFVIQVGVMELQFILDIKLKLWKTNLSQESKNPKSNYKQTFTLLLLYLFRWQYALFLLWLIWFSLLKISNQFHTYIMILISLMLKSSLGLSSFGLFYYKTLFQSVC